MTHNRLHDVRSSNHTNDYRVSGYIATTLGRDRPLTNNLAFLATGRLQLVRIWLPAVPITSVVFWANTTTPYLAGTDGDPHQWFGIFDIGRVPLALTVDDLGSAWASNGEKALAINGGPYTPPAEGAYMLGIMLKGQTVPSLYGAAHTNNSLINKAPLLCQVSTVGLTTPASAGAGAQTSGSASAGIPYAAVS